MNQKTKSRLKNVDVPLLEVLSWARAVEDSIIAGDYNIPKEMTYAINNIQDSVHKALNLYSNYPNLPSDYVTFKKKQVDEREKRIKELFTFPK